MTLKLEEGIDRHYTFPVGPLGVGLTIERKLGVDSLRRMPGVIPVLLALPLLEIHILSLHRNVGHNTGLDLSSWLTKTAKSNIIDSHPASVIV